MCKVSIVVPVYNAGSKLHKCIKSILAQTFTDFELVIVNDGSTDNSLNICRAYVDKRIKVINKKNEGTIAARRDGIEITSSKYITFVDADDWVDRNYVLHLYNETINSDADVTCCSYNKVMDGFGLIKKVFTSKYYQNDKLYVDDEVRTELAGALFHGHPFHSGLCAKLYKKELLLSSGKYLDRIKFLGDDLYYNMEVLLKSKKVKCIDNPLYYYRVGGYSSKYMPYLFDDVVNGYQIQKEVIAESYQDDLFKKYRTISIMIINTFPTFLNNLFCGNLKTRQINDLISKYTNNETVIECVENEDALTFFKEHPAAQIPMEFITAIKNKDIAFLYNYGFKKYNQSKIKNYIVTVLSKAL
ncbi:glycosyltransferase [Paenibacillus frigoriresistens]|uniref:glycosyltransferase family 2 protein n=1 Tax=Paenibacillus alginolyticus TaxID=59839 RepID=UPI0015678509|nr:glycosyltransferase [Paenibacillus frigoriresistens]NRF90531.1 glycosyltransferase [Paenibacillus frigoriresistens]